jgi:2-C-methyl-D-erythritol 4-phosphate cytidylyltransferase
MPSFAVIIPAGGSSSRFGANKLTQVLAGQSVLWRSVTAFASRKDVPLVVVAGPTHIDAAKVRCVPGGRCRAESVRNALAAVPPEIEWVAVHDAARPLVSQGLIDSVLTTAIEQNAAAAPATPVALTIKQAKAPLPAKVQKTVPRDELWAMQTPQIMPRRDLADAFARCPIALEEITDDVQLLELAGRPVWLVEGDDRNIKITRPIDLAIAEMLLNQSR